MSDDVRDNGYDDFLDAVEAGEPYYLESPSEDGWLPPAMVDPNTGDGDLTEQPLPETGEIITFTTTNVAGPAFSDDAPFVVAIADFGPVTITGQLRDIEPEDAAIGQEVRLDVGQTETTGDRLLVFRPA